MLIATKTYCCDDTNQENIQESIKSFLTSNSDTYIEIDNFTGIFCDNDIVTLSFSDDITLITCMTADRYKELIRNIINTHDVIDATEYKFIYVPEGLEDTSEFEETVRKAFTECTV